MTPDASGDETSATTGTRLAAALTHAGDNPFAAVVGATRIAVSIADARQPGNPLVFVNESFTRLTGYSADEVTGRNCRFLQGPETDPASVAAIRTAVAAGEAIEIDLLNYRRDGSSFWNRLAIAPVFDAARKITFLFASQTDVTAERARSAALTSDNESLSRDIADRDRSLRTSDERLRYASEAAKIGVWEISLPDLTLSATPTLNEIYGLPGGAPATVAAIRAVTHPDDAARIFALFDAKVAGVGDDDYFVQYRVNRADGRVGWIEARGELVRRADGTPLRLVGVSQDITTRRAAETQLELNEESLRLATDAAKIGTWDLDLMTDVLTWSDRTKAMFGISPGVPCSMVDFYAGLHPEDYDATAAAFGAAIDPATRAEYDVIYRTVGKEDGVIRWISARGKGLFAGDVCVRAVGTAIDITRQRRTAAREALVLRLGEQIGALADPAAIIAAAMTTLGRELGASRVGYGQVQDDDATIVLVTPYLDGSPDLAGTYPLDGFGAPMIAHNRAGETVAIGDTASEATLDQATWTALGVRAFVSVPLIRGGRLRATLFVNRLPPGEWDAADVALIEEVAARTWDAVERARAEAERQASEARLRAVIDAAPVGLIFADAPDGRITGGNARAEAMLRHPIFPSPDVAHYREWSGFHPDGRRIEGHEYPLARALAGEERPEIEAIYHRGDGTDAWLRFIAAPIRATGRDITGAVVASIDIDAERRADIALRELNATLEQRVAETAADRDAIWRESRDLLLIISPEGIIEAANPAWTETLGYAVDELVGRHYGDFVVPDDIPASDAALAAAPGAPLRGFENRYRHADGSIRDFSWTAAGSGGKIYCVARDITARKAAERELEVAQEALRQAQKMEAVGQLTGGIAHDFNNMLAVVLGSLDLLGRRLGDADARAKRYVDAAIDGARRAATLTQRLLAFSRQQPLQPEPVDVNRLVAGMSDLLRGSLGGGVQIETVLAGGLWPVHADPNHLENVILNLAINARDAMDGEGRLTIETACTHLDDRYVAAEVGIAAGQYVMIAVTDAGAGMPPDVIAKAFDPFFTTKRVGQGTGLGLSQVYGFVRQSGGHVRIYSEVGVGTTVKLYLPRLTGVTVDAPGSAAASAPVGGDLELILVVDDEPSVRAVTVDSLRDLGYRVVEAEGAAAALALLAAHPDVALLFTDIVMPETNGARLAEAARAVRPGLKVLFTTGYTRNAVVHNGVVDAGVELIGKPFTFEALAAKVRSVLDGG